MDLDKSNARRDTAANTGRVDRFGRVVHLDETVEQPADGAESPFAPGAVTAQDDPFGETGRAPDDTTADDTTDTEAIDDVGSNASDWSASTAIDDLGGPQDVGIEPVSISGTSLGAGAALTSAGAAAAGAVGTDPLTGNVADVVPSQIEIIAPPMSLPSTPGSVTISTSSENF